MLPTPLCGPILMDKILPMAMNGPTTSPETCCRYTCVGPFLELKILPIVMNGPTSFSEICYQLPCVGLFLWIKNTANGHKWAHSFSKTMLPLVLNGPVASFHRCYRLPLMSPFLLVDVVVRLCTTIKKSKREVNCQGRITVSAVRRQVTHHPPDTAELTRAGILYSRITRGVTQ